MLNSTRGPTALAAARGRVQAFAFATCALSILASGTAAFAQSAENAEVYVVATELADEVELIREVMGRPYDESPRLPAAGITLFELYFQAETLLRKSNQLAHELAGAERLTLPPVPAGEIGAREIMPLVQGALAEIRRVRTELGIAEPVVRVTRETAIAPTGVFSVMLDTNRQLNLLLREPMSSADVHAKTSIAVQYAAAILAARGVSPSVPAVPFEPYRRPADVYTRLLECIDLVAAIAPRVGVEVLSMSSRRNIPDNIEPGHVYDVAEILVADLILFARRLGVDDPRPLPDDAPKHVFPSHSYQHAGVLKAQLETLAAQP